MHLMRWQQLFPQIFLCSYPFLVHLKSIFIAGVSWKVVQGKTKLTLLTYVRSEEDDPLGLTPLGIYLLYYLLRDLFPYFLLLGRIVIKKWDFKPNAKAQVLAPTITFSILDNYLNNTSHSSLTTLFKYSFLILSLLFVPNIASLFVLSMSSFSLLFCFFKFVFFLTYQKKKFIFSQ